MKYDKFIEKYGHIRVKFSSYYKYSFTFTNGFITVGSGGNHDDIYRMEVSASVEYPIETLFPEWAEVDGKFISF